MIIVPRSLYPLATALQQQRCPVDYLLQLGYLHSIVNIHVRNIWLIEMTNASTLVDLTLIKLLLNSIDKPQ